MKIKPARDTVVLDSKTKKATSMSLGRGTLTNKWVPKT